MEGLWFCERMRLAKSRPQRDISLTVELARTPGRLSSGVLFSSVDQQDGGVANTGLRKFWLWPQPGDIRNHTELIVA